VLHTQMMLTVNCGKINRNICATQEGGASLKWQLD